MAAGRPPKLDLVIRHRDVYDTTVDPPRVTGREPVTVIDSIVGDLRAGMPAHRAAKRAGISSDTFYEWEKVAGRARAKQQRPGAKLTAYDVGCLEFSDRVNQAELEWELATNIELERISRGGIVTETVVEVRDNAGTLVSRKVTTGATLPDARTLLTRLKLRLPDVYRERIDVGGDGEGGAIPVELRARSLAEALRDFQDAAAEKGRKAPRSRRKPPAAS